MASKIDIDTSPQARAAASEDWGNFVHVPPHGVVRPVSAQDVAAALEVARSWPGGPIPVAVRGSGHALWGQCQVVDRLQGLVLDMSSLPKTLEVDEAASSVVVSPNMFIRDVISALEWKHWRQLPSAPAFYSVSELTVGGLLTSGGLGSWSVRAGPVCAHVLALEVVTGSGAIKNVRVDDPGPDGDLARAILGGYGQYAVITKVELKTIPKFTFPWFGLHFESDPVKFMERADELANGSRVQHMIGLIAHVAGKWRYAWEVTSYFDSKSEMEGAREEARKAASFSGLDAPVGPQFAPHTNGKDAPRKKYEYWLNTLLPSAAATGELLKEIFVPANEGILKETSPVYIVLPMARSAFDGVPMFTLPDLRPNEPSDYSYYVGFFSGADDREGAQQLEDFLGKVAWPASKAVGGNLYDVGSVVLDWPAHYGAKWTKVQELKKRFDPHNMLGRGYRMPF